MWGLFGIGVGRSRGNKGEGAYREAMLTMLVEPLVVAMGCSRGTMKGETATDSCVCWEGGVGECRADSS